MTKCSECDDPAYGRGLCRKHYLRARYRERIAQARGLLREQSCAECGAIFKPKTWNSAKYCSRKCSAKSSEQRRRCNVELTRRRQMNDAQRYRERVSATIDDPVWLEIRRTLYEWRSWQIANTKATNRAMA